MTGAFRRDSRGQNRPFGILTACGDAETLRNSLAIEWGIVLLLFISEVLEVAIMSFFMARMVCS